jgi:hypothetical protein
MSTATSSATSPPPINKLTDSLLESVVEMGGLRVQGAMRAVSKDFNKQLATNPSVRGLDLSKKPFFEHQLRYVVKQYPALTHLTLGGKHITDIGVVLYLTRLPQLQSLVLLNTTVDPEASVDLLKGYARLQGRELQVRLNSGEDLFRIVARRALESSRVSRTMRGRRALSQPAAALPETTLARRRFLKILMAFPETPEAQLTIHEFTETYLRFFSDAATRATAPAETGNTWSWVDFGGNREISSHPR